ncbi:hypothetical protein GCM10022243_49080 [Saccharothrix violaceirubra]|uniref:Uncharacterized protein n=1 Tax=Saccharothrix violaceirubra TaxID=413306 RepID=A0A7W7SZH6_9PSEU|nr:hypothetical protein [Saccharothrix violaceirubra]MBB4963749.1 hypothetical protein [Saccharothrix violaceirubra]
MTTACDCPDRMHGYGLGDLTAIARRATANARARGDVDLLHEAAWNGLVDCLLASETHPGPCELAVAARDGILNDIHQWQGHRGRRKSWGNPGARFAAYWHSDLPALVDPRIEALVDRIATEQVTHKLPRHQADLLLLLAATGSVQAVATARGLPYETVKPQVRQARRCWEDLWFDWEHAHRVRHAKIRPRRPIQHGTINGYAQHRRRYEQACDDCRHAARAYNRALAACGKKGKAK